MNPNEHELQYPWAEAPATGAWITLRPGLHWVRMPLPFALDHINLWVLDDEIEGRPGFTTAASLPTRRGPRGSPSSMACLRADPCCGRSVRTSIRIISGSRTG
jgi:hypothetical protein